MEPAPDHFEVVGERGFYRPAGCMSLAEAVALVDAVLAYARARGIKELVVNGILVTGFDPPTISERYFLVEKWALTAHGAVRMAMVLRPEMIDPEKFGVTVAFNRRLIADVFLDEGAAVAWLDRRVTSHANVALQANI
jgi:hypothetical protein